MNHHDLEDKSAPKVHTMVLLESIQIVEMIALHL